MKAKHTEGPWVRFNGENEFAIFPAGRAGFIAENIKNKADALLIASAPDLLEALKGACRDLGDITRHWGTDGSLGQANALLKELQTISAKAEGLE